MELKITKGEWISSGYRVDTDIADGLSGICEMCGWMSDEEMKANAKLIADAGNTANKCGLLPSEIIKQRDELLEACKAAKIDTEMLLDGSADFTSDNLLATIENLENAIKKAIL